MPSGPDKDPTFTNPDVSLPVVEIDDATKAMKELARIHRRLKAEFPTDLRVWVVNNLYVLTSREAQG